MRCYYVLVHGRLDWLPARSASDEIGATKPTGFYCHRYVLARDNQSAAEIAFQRVKQNLDSQMGWIRDQLVTVELQAEEVAIAPIHKLLKGDNRGHTFY